MEAAGTLWRWDGGRVQQESTQSAREGGWSSTQPSSLMGKARRKRAQGRREEQRPLFLGFLVLQEEGRTLMTDMQGLLLCRGSLALPHLQKLCGKSLVVVLEAACIFTSPGGASQEAMARIQNYKQVHHTDYSVESCTAFEGAQVSY